MKRSNIGIGLIAIAASLAPGRAECGNLVDIGSIGGPITNGFAINDAGQVTGQATVADGSLHAFIYSGGAMKDLGLLPGGTFSVGKSINNDGQIAGSANNANSGTSNGITGDLSGMRLVPGLDTDGSLANGINDSGTIVGTTYASNLNRFIAVQVLNGVPIYFGLSLGADTTANAISNTGLIVGQVLTANPSNPVNIGYLYTPDGMGGGSGVSLGGFGGSTLPFDVNDSGEVVGVGYLNAGTYPHAFYYANGTLMDLNRPGWDGSYAYGINDKGQVVGTYFIGNFLYPFLYDHGVYTDLNDLVDQSLGIVLTAAGAINNNGQILVTQNEPGNARTYILSLAPAAVPTPEPSTIVLAAIGLSFAALTGGKLRKGS